MNEQQYQAEVMDELRKEMECQEVFLVSGKSLRDWVNLKDGLDDFADKEN